jgi:hypothetical protein
VELLITATVMFIVLGMISAIAHSVQRSYSQQRPRMEALNNATAGMDTIIRIARMAGANPRNIANFPSTALPAIVPAANGIRMRADWNPADGDLNDPYEDIEFTVSDGTLLKKEASLSPTPDTTPVVFLENIESLAFTYFDVDNNVTNSGNTVAIVKLVMTTRTPDGGPMSFSSSAAVRRLER